jgi:peroxiredoxin
MPDLVKSYERYAPRGFELIAVAMAYDPPEYVANYTRKHSLPFKVVLDKDGSIAAAFGRVNLTPTAVLIDKDGRMLSRFVGEPDFASLHAAIERELAS